MLSRDEVAAAIRSEEGDYDPVAQTSKYMHRAVEVEERWETTMQQARTALLSVDARQLYFDFLKDITNQINSGSSKASMLANLLESVAFRGLGIRRQHLALSSPRRGATRWHVRMDYDAIGEHLREHVVGDHFLNHLAADERVWGGIIPIVGASDVSQHRSKVPIPARYFKRSVPFVLNNAAGTIYHAHNAERKYENVFNPRPDESLLRWMLIDPSYQDELEPEDFVRCAASAMDVGQYRFDREYLMKGGKRGPNIILRDGSLFPQDAYLDNYVIESKRGDFTREAIRNLLDSLLYADAIGTIYCGISKRVQLRVFSAVVDWFVATQIDPNWSVGNYTLNDGQMMSLLLATPSFLETNLQRIVITCLIRRSFTTRANLNTREDLDHLDDYFERYRRQHLEIDIAPYRRLCEIAHVFMFFMGHSKSPQQQLPRYEFFHPDSVRDVQPVVAKILASLQACGLAADRDHSFMSDEPVIYLMPTVTQQAHVLSKDVGKAIDSLTGQLIMARFRRLLDADQ